MKIVSLLAIAELGLTFAFAPVIEARAADAGLQSAIANPKRTPKFVARDAVRHPQQELEFFGLRPDMTVVEVWPGGGYWTEILAPYLKTAGSYYVAVPPPKDAEAPAPGKDTFRAKLSADPDAYGKVTVTQLGLDHYQVAPPGSVDLIVTKAGFEFVGASEINANPRDTKDWPKGVWTLPPSFALKDVDRDKYAAIGEADNFVLKFRKPKP
jgi:predicted methyltransferase